MYSVYICVQMVNTILCFDAVDYVTEKVPVKILPCSSSTHNFTFGDTA